MRPKLPLVASLLAASFVFGCLAACLSDNPVTPAADSGTDSTAGASGSSSGSGDGSGHTDANRKSDVGITDAQAEGSGLGLLVDNMTAPTGTQISLQVADGDIPGSYYTYSDYPVSAASGGMSVVVGDRQLVDTPIAPSLPQSDGAQIVGEICLGGGTNGSVPGQVVTYAGLGMNLVYGAIPDAASDAMCPPAGLSPPVSFDASHYSGVSFYIWVDPTDGAAPLPSVHFGIPDMQTADKCSIPAVACAQSDAGCYDDFGSDVTFTPGKWTKASFKFADLSQLGFGAAFTALKTDQLIGMKWQANGAGPDAAIESFRFCISDIYFTP
jgi:hypothetical protein